MQYLSFSISITIISWIIGMILHALIKSKPYYTDLSNLNFIESKRLNKAIGLGVFKWIVKNTFFKYFNQKIKLERRIQVDELYELRKEMSISDISHLLGFAVVTVFALVKFIYGNYSFGLVMMAVNIVLNLYPSLLQQENKRRIDKLIRIYS
ncbi:hypothetical protein [Cyclobacterium amurskyense]|uniref:glycosyl-4,4'-diaponeurosporenoate acyltransferase CrtO family protein n=1 Tax=Cyclobacterium amurskyense TaxID=320787 RepID=UPI0030DB057C|tara:strand:- start:40612 stop:41067 length:456 start_codon:yes stop_codon:yes gene_type:complete